MTHISEVIDLAELDRLRADKLIGAQLHPADSDYVILNYTNRAQYMNAWCPTTKACRGLSFRASTGEVLARPFAKFFNLGQLDSIPSGNFDAYEKMDGSLGVIYQAPDGLPAVSTRGSFASEQAQWATQFLRNDTRLTTSAIDAIAAAQTMLVEIIYPANRIVVNYGPKADLTYLATIDIETGVDTFEEFGWSGPKAQHYPGADLDAITAMNGDNAEGFVLRWRDCGTRAKAKLPEYVRLHKILTGVSERTIWEIISSGQSLDEIVELVPDEFHQWVQATVANLHDAYRAIEAEAFQTYSTLPSGLDRKAQAAIITKSAYPGIVFAMLDNKEYASKIFAMLKPAATKPFRDDVDG